MYWRCLLVNCSGIWEESQYFLNGQTIREINQSNTQIHSRQALVNGCAHNVSLINKSKIEINTWGFVVGLLMLLLMDKAWFCSHKTAYRWYTGEYYHSIQWLFLVTPLNNKPHWAYSPLYNTSWSWHAQTWATLWPGCRPVQPQPLLGVSVRREHPIHFHWPHSSWLSPFTQKDGLQMWALHCCGFEQHFLLLVSFSVLVIKKAKPTSVRK